MSKSLNSIRGESMRRDLIAVMVLSLPLILASGWHEFLSHIPEVQAFRSMTGLVLCLVLLSCAATDAVGGKIFNIATYSAMAWAIWINFASMLDMTGLTIEPGAIGVGDSLLGGLVCFSVMLASFLAAGGGGGDVKLATAIGLLLGVERGLTALVYTYLAAAGFGLAYLAARGALGAAAWTFSERFGVVVIPPWLCPPTADKRELLRHKLRMGPFFAFGAIAAVLEKGIG